jgi:hypothetical protein
MTPTKASQPGLDCFTAAVIPTSKAARLIGCRVFGFGERNIEMRARAVIFPPEILLRIKYFDINLEKPQSGMQCLQPVVIGKTLDVAMGPQFLIGLIEGVFTRAQSLRQ